MDGRIPLLLLFLWTLPGASPAAQAPGFAEITHPATGEAVRGVVTVEGTANHPSFDHFDLAFTFEGDDTGTWFAIVDEDRTRAVEGRLAVWDTSGIADGEYALRLRVWPAEGEPLEAIVHGLRLRNYTPVETPTAGPLASAPALIPTEPSPPTPSPTPPIIVSATPGPEARVGRALFGGGVAAVVLLASAGAYAAWRAASRASWGSARAARRAERRRRTRHTP